MALAGPSFVAWRNGRPPPSGLRAGSVTHDYFAAFPWEPSGGCNRLLAVAIRRFAIARGRNSQWRPARLRGKLNARQVVGRDGFEKCRRIGKPLSRTCQSSYRGHLANLTFTSQIVVKPRLCGNVAARSTSNSPHTCVPHGRRRIVRSVLRVGVISSERQPKEMRLLEAVL